MIFRIDIKVNHVSIVAGYTILLFT